MIGKIIGGVIGAKAAEHSSKLGGAGGALLGVAGAALLRRLGLPAMLALGIGGYAFKKWNDRRESAAGPAPKAKRAVPRRKPRKSPAKTAAAAA